jgi:hypothetical protein
VRLLSIVFQKKINSARVWLLLKLIAIKKLFAKMLDRSAPRTGNADLFHNEDDSCLLFVCKKRNVDPSILAPAAARLRHDCHAVRAGANPGAGRGDGRCRGEPHAINPGIYGVSLAETAALLDLNSPLNRYGGNNTSRYNWQLNAANRGADWYFESIAEPNATAGERGDTFINTSQSANAQAMITVPIIDWVAKLGANRSKLASFSAAKYGAQQATDAQWFPDAGNGVLARVKTSATTPAMPIPATAPAYSSNEPSTWSTPLARRQTAA